MQGSRSASELRKQMDRVTELESANLLLGGQSCYQLHHTRITVPQRHSITKLNHFIASPRFISLYYIMYLFISCNIFILQGLPYVKTFLIPYVNQSGLSHCPITFSTFRLLNAFCGLP